MKRNIGKIIEIVLCISWFAFWLTRVLSNKSSYNLGSWLIVVILLIIPYTLLYAIKKRDKGTNYIITLFGGWLGAHKFAQGKILMGILYFFTCGLFSIGWVVDTIKAFIILLQPEETITQAESKSICQELMEEFDSLYANGPENTFNLENPLYSRLYMNHKDDLYDYHELNLPMRLTYPPYGECKLNCDEVVFFSKFAFELNNNNLNPQNIRLHQKNDCSFDIYGYNNVYIGNIQLHKNPCTYAVFKNGKQRAIRVFDNFSDAESYKTEHNCDEIETRMECYGSHLQFAGSRETIHVLRNESLDKYISTIPKLTKRTKK